MASRTSRIWARTFARPLLSTVAVPVVRLSASPRIPHLGLLLSFFVLLGALLAHPVASQTHQAWSYNRAIYEVNVRQYTEAGTFAALDTHLDRLETLGVGLPWFMHIHPIGEENRLGSYYAVSDYYGVNPEFGTLGDFKRAVEQAQARGMRVIIDWVANHTAWDHPLTQTQWYATDSEGASHRPAPTGPT